ncbi:MAG TPA: anti-sigma factor [Candidatus Saccharimonadales bacterium]|jgi:anti-sigma factor RsiW|nr:anti-sigma factor [Candidatus Saccharimonadales bacterium]
MQCLESSRIRDAYLDGEIDALHSVELEDHLATCADCRMNLESQRVLKGLLQNASLRFSAPVGLQDEILRSLTLAPPESPVKEAIAADRRWLAVPAVRWRLAAAGLCAVLAGVFAMLLWSRGHAEQRLAEQVVDNHIRSMMANHLADVPSSDQHSVKPWFNGKLSFSPNVADLAAKGFPLAGGRLDYMDNQNVAALVYRRRAHIINVFIYPASGDTSPVLTQRRGYNLVHWDSGGMEYWAVSDLNASELQELVAMLRS